MNELELRRANLFKKMKENSAALIYCGTDKVSSEDEYYYFIPNTCFFYLTNIKQQNSVLLLVKGIGEEHTYLFIDEYSELKEKWTGKRIRVPEAKALSAIDNVLTLNNFSPTIKLALSDKDNPYGKIDTLYLDLTPEVKVYEDDETHEPYYTKDVADYFKVKYPHIKIENVKPMIAELRTKKSKYEVDSIRDAIRKTNEGINHTLAYMKPGLYEWQVAEEFQHYGAITTRTELSFPSIIAGGVNATILHYPQESDRLMDNTLVLFDLGYRTNNYCADISRTYPISGHFDDLQRRVYEAVLNANKAMIEYVHPGLTLKECNDYCTEFLRKEAIRLKLMDEKDDIHKYYYHNVSHQIGIDCHDTCDRSKPLEAGNIISDEPGLYFKDYGIGVRIEDDLLLTENGCEDLSIEIPKEISDIEKLMSSLKKGK